MKELWTPSRNIVMPRSWFKQRGFFWPVGFGNHYPKEILVDSADFDGANDFMTRGADLSGNADSKLGLVSFWARCDADNPSFPTDFLTGATAVGGPTIRFALLYDVAERFVVNARNTAETLILNMLSSTYVSSATWRHVLMSWDLGNVTARLYVNDTNDSNSPSITNDTIDYTRADWGVCGAPEGSAKFNGCVAEFYFAPGQYLDISQVANRRKFISARGKPVDLGTDGYRPTGVAPLIYLHLDDGESVANFATNRGTGGNFTLNGTLDTGSSSPSD